MRNRADMPVRRPAGRRDGFGEIPMVAALLVMAVVVAVFAAGGPVLKLFAAF